MTGSCDAITFDVGNMETMTKANPELVGIVFEEGKGFSEEVPVNIGVAKGHEDIVEKINEILAGISEEERQTIWSAIVEVQPQ